MYENEVIVAMTFDTKVK